MLTVTDISGVVFTVSVLILGRVLRDVYAISCFDAACFEEVSEWFAAAFPDTIAISCLIADTLFDGVSTSGLTEEIFCWGAGTSCLAVATLFDGIIIMISCLDDKRPIS